MFIGNKIIELRKKKNLTQEQLAEKLGVTRQTLSNWENNITSPDLNQASMLCQILKIDIRDLLDNNIEIDVKKSENSILSKLVGKEVYMTFDDEITDINFNITSKVRMLSINGDFVKIEYLDDKKNLIKLVDIDLIESIKLVEGE